jgi:fructose-1,6-bisphosphatase/inositol monophosphatase family enzyme
MTAYAKELEIGRRIARQAGEIALRYWGSGIGFESKPDDSPVTVADRETEQAIARLVEERFPADGLLGEEGARKDSANGRRWIIDPVDGTRDFVRGNPAWAVLLGFEAAGEVEAGFAYLPAMDQMFCAARGEGAFLNDSAIHVSSVSGPRRAVLCLNGLNGLRDFEFAPRLFGWMEQFWAVRSLGGCLDAMMVSRGQAELWIEPTAKPWDLAPLKVIGEEAGARFFNFDCGSSIYGGNCVLATPGLEAAARNLLGLGQTPEKI